jgi:tripartite-type tricarboxylate transporter receptor subunit TctC
VLVGFAPGGIADIVARLMGQKIADRLGQPVVVDNRAGAGGSLAARAVAQSNDGHTVLAITTALAINATLQKDAGYDPLRDFVPVSIAAATPEVFAVSAANPARTLQDYIRLGKGRALSYSTAGVGSSSHLAGQYLLASLAGLDDTHVPFQGGAPAVTAVVGGQVDLVVTSLPAAITQVRAGRLRALAVSSPRRVAALSEVPTVAESGFADYEALGWVGFFMPAKTPREVVQKLNGLINEALHQPDVRERLAGIGFEPVGGSPEENLAYLRAEVARWRRMVQVTGVSAD